MQTIVALFDSPAEAEVTVSDLELAGFPRSDVSVVVGERPHGSDTSNSAGVGAALGAGVGLLGSLVDLGVPALEARYYHKAVRRGGTLLSFAVEDQEQIRALEIIQKHHPVDIKERAMAWHEEGWNAESTVAPAVEEIEAVEMPTSSMGTIAAPTAQPTREISK